MRSIEDTIRQHTLWRLVLRLIHGHQPRFADVDLTNGVIMSQNLRWADFSFADCSTATFVGCDLRHADFSGANLVGAKFIDCKFTMFYHKGMYYCKILAQNNLRAEDIKQSRQNADTDTIIDIKAPIYPAGPLTGYKILHAYDNSKSGMLHRVIALARLTIPADADRAIYKNGKCRASKAYVEDIYDLSDQHYTYGHSCIQDYPPTTYNVGEYVVADTFDKHLFAICTNGIHFFLTENEAIDYMRVLAV